MYKIINTKNKETALNFQRIFIYISQMYTPYNFLDILVIWDFLQGQILFPVMGCCGVLDCGLWIRRYQRYARVGWMVGWMVKEMGVLLSCWFIMEQCLVLFEEMDISGIALNFIKGSLMLICNALFWRMIISTWRILFSGENMRKVQEVARQSKMKE